MSHTATSHTAEGDTPIHKAKHRYSQGWAIPHTAIEYTPNRVLVTAKSPLGSTTVWAELPREVAANSDLPCFFKEWAESEAGQALLHEMRLAACVALQDTITERARMIAEWVEKERAKDDRRSDDELAFAANMALQRQEKYPPSQRPSAILEAYQCLDRMRASRRRQEALQMLRERLTPQEWGAVTTPQQTGLYMGDGATTIQGLG